MSINKFLYDFLLPVIMRIGSVPIIYASYRLGVYMGIRDVLPQGYITDNVLLIVCLIVGGALGSFLYGSIISKK